MVMDWTYIVWNKISLKEIQNFHNGMQSCCFNFVTMAAPNLLLSQLEIATSQLLASY